MDSILISYIAILVFSVVIHEVGHGYAALKLGDQTAYRLGRLTLNPIPHVDIMMTIVMPLIFLMMQLPPLGGAKPVPVQPANFIHASPRRGMMLVAAAGPATNLALVLISIALLHLTTTPQSSIALYDFLEMSVFINAILCIFNMLPIPPLDGSKVLMGVLPREVAFKYMGLERFGFILVIVAVVTGVIRPIFVFSVELLRQLLPSPPIVMWTQSPTF